MGTHIDAIGYLQELVETIDKKWFSKIYDYAIVKKDSRLNPEEMKTLVSIFKCETDYKTPTPTYKTVSFSTATDLPPKK